MLRLFIYVGCLVMLADVALGRFINMAQVPKGMTVHNVVLPWEDANAKCQSKGAILASPVNDNMYSKMRSVINVTKSTFYTGTKAIRFGEFVSAEGVPLENMTVGIWKELNPWNGDCLAMTADGLLVVPCETRLPYICYQPSIADNKTVLVNSSVISCGSSHEGYEYSNSTKSCYKLNNTGASWDVALAQCVSEGAHLAIIEDANEAEFIKNMKIVSVWLYIGLRYHKGTTNWISVQGQSVQFLYDDWVSGARPSKTELECGGIRLSSGKLDDLNCGASLPYVCERPPYVSSF